MDNTKTKNRQKIKYEQENNTYVYVENQFVDCVLSVSNYSFKSLESFGLVICYCYIFKKKKKKFYMGL